MVGNTIKFTSVWLGAVEEKRLKPFRCFVCGKIVFEYFSSARMVMPGESETMKAPIVVQCNGTMNVRENGQEYTTRCKQKYYIE